MRYVDDICGGADTLEHLTATIQEVVQFLKEIGISLAKWSTNSPQFLQGISISSQQSKIFTLDEVVSSLGLHWIPRSDKYRFSHSLPPYKKGNTKPSVVSTNASFFYPVGWVIPVTIKAKMFTQELGSLALIGMKFYLQNLSRSRRIFMTK